MQKKEDFAKIVVRLLIVNYSRKMCDVFLNIWQGSDSR